MRKICELNNALSPDILTAVANARTAAEAYGIAGVFEDTTGEDLPFPLDEWRLRVKAPVELYFVFKRKRDQGRFVRTISKEFPEVEVIV